MSIYAYRGLTADVTGCSSPSRGSFAAECGVSRLRKTGLERIHPHYPRQEACLCVPGISIGRRLTSSDLRRVAVRPRYQGNGVASRLLQWGVDMADREGITGWLNARPAGLSIYQKAGWQPVVVTEFQIPGIETGPVTSMIRKPVAHRKGVIGVVEEDMQPGQKDIKPGE